MMLSTRMPPLPHSNVFYGPHIICCVIKRWGNHCCDVTHLCTQNNEINRTWKKKKSINSHVTRVNSEVNTHWSFFLTCHLQYVTGTIFDSCADWKVMTDGQSMLWQPVRDMWSSKGWPEKWVIFLFYFHLLKVKLLWAKLYFNFNSSIVAFASHAALFRSQGQGHVYQWDASPSLSRQGKPLFFFFLNERCGYDQSSTKKRQHRPSTSTVNRAAASVSGCCCCKHPVCFGSCTSKSLIAVQWVSFAGHVHRTQNQSKII